MKEYRKDGEEVIHEDRSSPRHIVHEKALMMALDRERQAVCTVLDLSRGGCRLLLEDRFPLERDAQVEVKFTLRGTPLRFCGAVRWWNCARQVGIGFQGLSERRLEIRSDAIQDLRAARAAMRERGPLGEPFPNCEEESWRAER